MVKAKWGGDEFVMNINDNLNTSPFKEPFFKKLKCLFIGLPLLVVVIIGLSNSRWEDVLSNFLLSILFLVGVAPNIIKFFNPEMKFKNILDRFIDLNSEFDSLNFQVIMNYLGNVATISLCYTVLGYAQFKLDLAPVKYWPFISAPIVLVLLLMSSLCIIDFLYRSGLFVKRTKVFNFKNFIALKRTMLVLPIGLMAFSIQILFLNVGIDAINQYKPSHHAYADLQQNKINQRL